MTAPDSENLAPVRGYTDGGPNLLNPDVRRRLAIEWGFIEPVALDDELLEAIHWAEKLGAIGHPSRQAAAIRKLAAPLSARLTSTSQRAKP